MARNSLKKEIINIFNKDKGWKIQTTRDNISRFKIKYCSNCTQNASAYILGLAMDVKVWRKLNKEDRESLPNNISEIVERYKTDKNLELKKHKKETKIITKNVGKESPYDFPLSKFNIDEELIQDCKLVKPYRGGIREALLTLETKIKKKLKTKNNGKPLIQECKSRGVFDREEQSEKEGLFFLFMGAIEWLRNPPSHNKINYSKEDAIKIILFTDHLIKLFYELCNKNNIN